MHKRMVKLAFALGILAGGVAGFVPTTQAEAMPVCPNVCLDPDCTCQVRCWYVRTDGSCVCEDSCVYE